MRVRNGFVSNSSSSSFIIAYVGDSKPCPHCGRHDANILDVIKRIGDADDESGVRAEGADAVLEYTDDFSDDTAQAIRAAVDVATKAGKQVAYVSISYHNEALADMISGKIIYDLN